MASQTASRLKKEWGQMPSNCFETLTFGELKIGEKFIGLPEPGDNHGHGGLKGSHYVFIKTCKKVTNAGRGIRYGVPHGRAKNIRTGDVVDNPAGMPVIRVE